MYTSIIMSERNSNNIVSGDLMETPDYSSSQDIRFPSANFLHSTLTLMQPDNPVAVLHRQTDCGSSNARNIAPKIRSAAESIEDRSFASVESFENMITDLRRVFIGWLRKTEAELRSEKERLICERKEIRCEGIKLLKQLEIEKQIQLEKIKEERRKAEYEIVAQTKQLQIERDDTKKKIDDDIKKFEKYKEMQRRKLLHDREKFEHERESFIVEARRIRDNQIATETKVDLNVGGLVFETARHVLVQQSGSYLEALFSGRHVAVRDRHGRIFIDRDSELFRILLNFLRNPQTPPVPRSFAESELIAREAEYYGIRFYPFPLVFSCGGQDGVEHLRDVELLDSDRKCWRPCRKMITERAYFGSAVLHNRLYLYGGQNLNYKALHDSEIYDCLSDCWFPGAPLNYPRRNTCGVELGGRLYTIGGFDGTNIMSSVEAYDPRMKNWMHIEPLNVPRSAAMCCVENDQIIVLGGTKGERLRSLECYNPKMEKWETIHADMIEVRSAGSACALNSLIYAIGGTDNSHIIHSSMEVFDYESHRWSFLANMNEPRMDFASVIITDLIMVGGGQNGNILNSVEFYKPELNQWHEGPPLSFPKYGHSFLLANL